MSMSVSTACARASVFPIALQSQPTKAAAVAQPILATIEEAPKSSVIEDLKLVLRKTKPMAREALNEAIKAECRLAREEPDTPENRYLAFLKAIRVYEQMVPQTGGEKIDTSVRNYLLDRLVGEYGLADRGSSAKGYGLADEQWENLLILASGDIRSLRSLFSACAPSSDMLQRVKERLQARRGAFFLLKQVEKELRALCYA